MIKMDSSRRMSECICVLGPEKTSTICYAKIWFAEAFLNALYICTCSMIRSDHTAEMWVCLPAS